MDGETVALGGLMIAVSCVILLEAAPATGAPLSMAALGAIGLSVGSLLADSVGTRRERPHNRK